MGVTPSKVPSPSTCLGGCGAWPPPLLQLLHARAVPAARAAAGRGAVLDELAVRASSKIEANDYPIDEDRSDGHRILAEILANSERCISPQAARSSSASAPAPRSNSGELPEFQAQQLIDEADHKYWLVMTSTSPVVSCCLWKRWPDLTVEEVKRALVEREERLRREPECEFERYPSKSGVPDPFGEEHISYVIRTVKPFPDRELLLRRWQLELPTAKGRGVALVFTSSEDNSLLPARDDRVRAKLIRAGQLIRPLHREGQPGVDIVNYSQLDMGGVIAPWLTRWIMSLTCNRTKEWASMLHAHCTRERARRLSEQIACPEVQREASWAFAGAAGMDEGAAEGQQGAGGAGADAGAAARGEVARREVLDAVLALERRCLSRILSSSPGSRRSEDTFCLGDPTVVLNEQDTTFCLGYSPASSRATGYLKVTLDDAYPRDVWRAITDSEECLCRDGGVSYKVLQKARPGDPYREEVVSLRLPTPLQPCDTLQRRWVLPLRREGRAIVSRSFEDPQVLPKARDRTRSWVQHCGYLLRPKQESFEQKGVELTVLLEIDIGCACPEGAQEKLRQWATDCCVRWAKELRAQCRLRLPEARGAQGALSAATPAGAGPGSTTEWGLSRRDGTSSSKAPGTSWFSCGCGDGREKEP